MWRKLPVKIVIFGSGYVSLSKSTLLAHQNEAVGLDIASTRVAMLNRKQSPIEDVEIAEFLAKNP